MYIYIYIFLWKICKSKCVSNYRNGGRNRGNSRRGHLSPGLIYRIMSTFPRLNVSEIRRGIDRSACVLAVEISARQWPYAPATVRVRVHRSQVFIGIRSTFQPVRVRACGGALRNPNQPRFIGRQPEARVYTEPPKGEWQRRVSLSRRPIDKIPSCTRLPPFLITCISSVRNGSRFRSKYSPDT